MATVYEGIKKKIQDFMGRASVTILVGIPRGEQHAPIHHINHETGEETTSEPIDLAELAAMQSLGAEGIPARPFLEDAMRENKAQIKNALEAAEKRAKDDQDPQWERVGAQAVGIVQEFVRGDYYKTNTPNSQQTIDAKGSDKPLIDTAQLLNAVTYQVRE